MPDPINTDVTIPIQRKSIYAAGVESSLITFKELYYFVHEESKKSLDKDPKLSRLEVDRHDVDGRVSTPLSSAPTKPILRGVNGAFRPGRMTAIMGLSGAGKTTLMNTIAGRLQGGFIEGDIMVNGIDITASKMRKISGFVHQEDVIMSTMTPREAIRMSAKLRLPESMSDAEKEVRIKDVLSLMNLGKAADTQVGSVLQHGISGGEKKRTCIAMEMITNPSILFLDEPTSGLDTYNAYRVVSSLSSLAKQNRTIISTIHQPSSEIFYLFDDVVLLSGGQIVYHGPVQQAVAYFSLLGFPCPMYTNPADYFFMEILRDSDKKAATSGSSLASIEAAAVDAVESSTKLSESLSQSSAEDRLHLLCTKWKSSAENTELMQIIEQSLSNPSGLNATSFKIKASAKTQLKVLCHRAACNMLRNKFTMHLRLAQAIIFGLMIAGIYWGIDKRGPEAQVQDRMGALYFMTTNMFMSSMMATLNVFFEEKAVFQREYMGGYYSLLCYYISKILIEFPFYVFYPFLTTLICYFLTGLQRTAGNFFICCLINILNANAAMGIGLMAAAAFPHIGIAMGIMPLVFIPLMVFSGLMVNLRYITDVLSWIQWISPMKYAFGALCINEFKDLPLPEKDGNVILSNFSILPGPFSLVGNILMQILFYVICLFFAYLALHRITKRSRPKVRNSTTGYASETRVNSSANSPIIQSTFITK